MTRMGKIFLLILLIVIGMGACKKDAPIPPISGVCTPKKQFLVSSFAKDRFQFAAPYFNPLNSNEFVYQYMDFENLSFQLRKFNIETMTNELLMEDIRFINQPKWNRNGWIVTDNYFDHQIWAVNEIGDSLIEISIGGLNYSPCWDFSSTRVYYRSSQTQGHPYFFLSRNLDNSIADTLLFSNGPNYGFTIYNDVSIHNALVSITFIDNSLSLSVSDLNDLNFERILDMDKSFDVEMPTGLCWNYDGSKIFISIYDNGTDRISGLFEVDIYSGQLTKRMEYCWDRQYSNISASPDGDYLIGERIDSYYRLNENGEPNGVIVENSSIYLIDLLTMEETKISLE
jgi:hypothetical protein